MNECQYRSSFGLDFISESLQSDNRFSMEPVRKNKEKPAYNFLFHLEAISVLKTGWSLFGKKNLKKAADRAEEVLIDSTFLYDDHLIIVFDQASFTHWNAIASIIAIKNGEVDRAKQLLQSVVESVEKTRVNPIFPPLSSTTLQKGAEKSTCSQVGLILLSLLIAHKELDNSKYFETAKQVGNLISGMHIRFSGYDAWGLTMLETPFYLKRRDRMIQAMERITRTSMTSLFASMLQQSLVSDNRKDEELLKIQFQNQIETGAFIGRPKYPNIRLDYTIHNVFSFLQFMTDKPDWKLLV